MQMPLTTIFHEILKKLNFDCGRNRTILDGACTIYLLISRLNTHDRLKKLKVNLNQQPVFYRVASS